MLPSLLSFGAYVPEQVLHNEALAERLGCTAEWIYQMSGIRQRRIATEGESVSDLGAAAARDCLAKANVQPGELAMVIVSSGTGELRFPGPASLIGAQLGIAGVPCLDLPVASAGSLFALSLASRLTPQLGLILVVAAEKMCEPALREPLERNVAILFGDGAGACLVGDRPGGLRVLDSALHSDGAYADDLRLELDGRLSMNGMTVILQAARKIPGGINSLLERHSLTPGQIAMFVMHQANQNLILRVAKVMGVPGERFYSNIERYGNTSSASLLIAAEEYVRGGTLEAGDKVCFAAFGAGFHWGALLAEKA